MTKLFEAGVCEHGVIIPEHDTKIEIRQRCPSGVAVETKYLKDNVVLRRDQRIEVDPGLFNIQGIAQA